MGLRTFKNGVHPFEGKELSKEKPVKELLPKGELVFPVSQHIGAPAKPVVKAMTIALAAMNTITAPIKYSYHLSSLKLFFILSKIFVPPLLPSL